MYSFQTRVRYSETDQTGRLSLPALLNDFQDCASFHSECIGESTEEMTARGIAWVLMSWQVELARMPSLGETVEACTSPYRVGGCLGMRDFCLKSKSGETLALADTVWALISRETGRPVHVPDDFLTRYSSERLAQLTWKADSLRPHGAPQTMGAPIAVTPGMLDGNRHTNNVWYVRLAQDALPEGFAFSRLCVSYKKPALLGCRLYPCVEVDETRALVSLEDEAQTPYALVAFLR